MCVLASREQMCLDKDVLAAKSSAAQNNMCSQKVKRKTCNFHRNVDSKRRELSVDDAILDLEDLHKLGLQHQTCPYYLSRTSQAQADIIFLPYNYLIDSYSRKSQNINLKNAIVIIDEGHNLESICSESSSFELSTLDISNGINELQDTLRDIESGLLRKDVEPFEALLKILQGFLKAVLELDLSRGEITKPGSWIYTLFKNVGVNTNNVEMFLVHLTEAITYSLCTLICVILWPLC